MDTVLGKDCQIAKISRRQNPINNQLQVKTLAVLLLFYCVNQTALAANENWPSESSTGDIPYLKFVNFDPGEYRTVKESEIEKIAKSIGSLPQNTIIRLIGQSQSRTSLASKQLALHRAKVLKQKLLELNIPEDRLVLDAEFINNKKSGDILHGVLIKAESKTKPPEILNKSAVIQEKQTTPLDIETTPLLIAETNSDHKKDISSKSVTENSLCLQVKIQKGSLKSNIEREIKHCGYVMGEWKFGSDSEIIDWHIPNSYSTRVENDIFGVLSLIEKNYQLRAHIHQLDKSIDFLPSNRHKRHRDK